MQICAACEHPNAPHRGYCAGCGHMLRLVCRVCRFVNDHGDRFCGGCGMSLLVRAYATTAKLPAAASVTSDELEALFAANDDVLPAAGISQDDLDRLFAGAVVR